MKQIAVVASAVLMLMGGGMAGAQEGQPVSQAAEGHTVKKQTVCPVMGGQADTNIYVDALGKRVYFCCNACPAQFKKDPAKYIKKLEEEGVTLDKTPQAVTTNSPAATSPQGQDEHQADEHSGHNH